jgi:acetyl esterase/lipase
MRPVPKVSGSELLTAFFFIPVSADGQTCTAEQQNIASVIADASGQAAMMLNSCAQSGGHTSLFELFAAMRWLAGHGQKLGIDGGSISLIGLQLGANVASVLSMMALNDGSPKINLQILIDPQFYISRKPAIARPRAYCQGQEALKTDKFWVDMKQIFDLPLDSKTTELLGIPPTLIQLSQNACIGSELDYYCMKLLHAGCHVTCINYDDQNDSSNDTFIQFNESLMLHAAAELRERVTATIKVNSYNIMR